MLIVRPESESDGGPGAPRDSHASATTARIAVLTPEFEAPRARLLPVPASPAHGVSYITWGDDADPYEVAVAALSVPPADGDADPNLSDAPGSTIFIDGSVRHFIVDGLTHAAPGTRIVIAPVEIRRLRERKSMDELEVLKCVNEVRFLSPLLSLCRWVCLSWSRRENRDGLNETTETTCHGTSMLPIMTHLQTST